MWGDNAYDLAVVSLGAAPWLVQGYRSVAETAADTTLEARIIWQHLRLALYGMRRVPQRDEAWVDWRLARLFQGMCVFLASAPAAWLRERGAPDPP
jgi:hypothetical protein